MLERKRRRRGGERKEGGKEEGDKQTGCGVWGEGRGEGLPWHSPSHPHDPLHFWKRTQTRELVLCVKTEGGAVKIWPSVFLCGQTMTVLLGQDPLQ